MVCGFRVLGFGGFEAQGLLGGLGFGIVGLRGCSLGYRGFVWRFMVLGFRCLGSTWSFWVWVFGFRVLGSGFTWKLMVFDFWV